MFSATGDLLTGDTRRPDIYTLHKNEWRFCHNRDTSSHRFVTSKIVDRVSLLNRGGYCPIVSTVTGLARLLLGMVHTIVHLCCAIFDEINRARHLEEARLGGWNILRGAIEVVPIAGNLAVLAIDSIREKNFSDEANKLIEGNSEYQRNAILFGNGQYVAKMPIALFDQKVGKLERMGLDTDTIKIELFLNPI